MKLLIVEDETRLCQTVSKHLKAEGYAVDACHDGADALDYIAGTEYDAVILDIMLPGLDGEDVLLQIKGIPVIVVSARADLDDKVKLLLGGAADYVTKPFHLRELLARIAVQLRSEHTAKPASVLEFDDLTLHTDTGTVILETKEIRLTPTEHAILKLLMQNPSQVITKSLLLERISGDTPDGTESSLKMHISNLRKKLRQVNGRDYIEAVWGIGFKLRSGQ